MTSTWSPCTALKRHRTNTASLISLSCNNKTSGLLYSAPLPSSPLHSTPLSTPLHSTPLPSPLPSSPLPPPPLPSPLPSTPLPSPLPSPPLPSSLLLSSPPLLSGLCSHSSAPLL